MKNIAPFILFFERIDFTSDFSQFMKANKKVRANIFYPATKSLCDEKGEPLLWEIQPITTALNDQIREACTVEVPVKGKPNLYRQKVDTNKYMAKLICAAIVFPELQNRELQNSYGVMTPEELLKEMIDDAGEYTDLSMKIQEISGFTTLQEDVDEAKN